MDKKLVIPGDFLSDDVKLADEGTYIEDGKVFSSVFGIASLKTISKWCHFRKIYTQTRRPDYWRGKRSFFFELDRRYSFPV